MSHSAFSWDYYCRTLDQATTKDPHGAEYHKTHSARFLQTIEMMSGITGHAALEVGATEFFQLLLKHQFGFQEVWASIFQSDMPGVPVHRRFVSGDYSVNSTAIAVDLERDPIPAEGGYFDLVMLCEVIEHFDIDPMFALIELNRVMKTGANLMITTPNSCSARMAHKVALGYRPHFFMQYQRDRSPHRHNFEYDIHGLIELCDAAGFEVEKLETHDVFQPTDPEAIQFLRDATMPLHFRGDDIFLLARKVSEPVDRWPKGIYA